jgi:ElaB protein
MLTSPNGTDAKRDLHVGGVGSDASAALASVIDPLLEASETWVHRAQNLARNADDFVHDNPWQALGVVAVLGVTLGYLLSRRF